MTKRTPPYSPEVRARAVRMVLDHQGEYGSQYAAIRSIAEKIGCSGETWTCPALVERHRLIWRRVFRTEPGW